MVVGGNVTPRFVILAVLFLGVREVIGCKDQLWSVKIPLSCEA